LERCRAPECSPLQQVKVLIDERGIVVLALPAPSREGEAIGKTRAHPRRENAPARPYPIRLIKDVIDDRIDPPIS